MITLFLYKMFSSMQKEATLPQKPQFYNTDGLIAAGILMPFFAFAQSGYITRREVKSR